MKHLDLGSTYQFGGVLPNVIPDTVLIELCDDGSFCYTEYSNYGNAIPNSHQVFGDYTQGLPFPNNFFDLAAGACFLEHYEPNMLAAFREVYRVLVLGGFLKVMGCGAASRRYYDDAVAAGFEIWSPAHINPEDNGDNMQWGYATPYCFWKPDPAQPKLYRGARTKRSETWRRSFPTP